MGSGQSVRSHRDRPGGATRVALAIGGLLVLSASLWMLRWAIDPVRASGDTFWYTRYALEMVGVSQASATEEAARFTVSVSGSGNVEDWTALADTIDPRYPGIFLERPVYPATGAVLIPLLGPGAMTVSAFVAGSLLGAGFGIFVFRRTRSRLAAACATVLLFALPTGMAIVLLYADGWMLLWWVASLAAASWYLDSGERRAMLVLTGTAILLGLTKAANELVLGAGLVATWALLAAIGHPLARRGALLAAVAVLLAMAQIAVFQVLGLPGAVATMQDLLTRHFVVPDVSDPVGGLLRRDLGWIAGSARELGAAVRDPIGHGPLVVSIAVAAVGYAVLARRRLAWSLPWLLGGPASFLIVLLHPVSSEVPRLLAPIWIPVAIGLAMAVGALASRWPGARAPAREPTRPTPA